MTHWLVLFKKEMKESVRNFKWIWIPIVYLLLGIMQPISSYYLPDILKEFGGLPEGALFEFPVPTGAQVLSETLGQFSQIGFLVLALAFMGVVAGERNSGTQLMVLVKPVSYIAYLTSKWVHMCLLAVGSFLLGFSIATYYTFLLFESIPFINVITGALLYSLSIVFVMTLILFFSALFKSTAAVAFLTVGITITLSLLSNLMPDLMRWSPGMIPYHIQHIFQTGSGGEGIWLPIICTLLLVFAMVGSATYIFSNKETAVHTT